jgi:hypothetical protein
VIQQALATSIKALVNPPAPATPSVVNVSMSSAAGIALVGGIVTSSARGPSINGQTIKPEIGAPGASVSAEVGTGNGETGFGGTSGATPMVAGAAALLLQAHPNRSPSQIKAMLMNSAETVVYTNQALLPGGLAPITRIGAGELRVDRAIGRNVVAYNRETNSAALSFGAHEVSDKLVLEKKLRIENLSNVEKLYTVTPTFRYADDQASGAVKVQVKSTLRVGRRDKEELEVKLTIDPTKLPAWTIFGSSSGAALNGPEYDGYITLTAGSEKLSIPWHVLPRKAAETSTDLAHHGKPGPTLKLRNRGLDGGDFDVFSLTGVSRKIPRSQLPGPGDNFAVIDMRSVGVRHLPAAVFGADFLEFAINTNGRRAHPNYPAEFDVYLDTTGDGVPDFVVFNAENGGFGATGQNVTFLFSFATGTATAFFFTDADLNSVTDFNLTDEITGMRFTPGIPRFGVVGLPFGGVASKGSADLGVTTATLPDTLSSELGLLMMYRRNAGQEADAVRIR